MSTRDTRGGPAEILHFVSTFEVKTDTKWLVALARHLDAATHRMSVACFYGAGPLQARFESLGVKTFNLQSPCESDPRAIVRAKELIERVRPDVVHTHLLRADIFAGTAARWAGVPVVISGVYAVGRFRRAKRRRTDFVFDRVSASLPTHFLAVSGAVKDDFVERHHVAPQNVSVIHTGIDPPMELDAEPGRQLRQVWRVGSDQPLVVTVARLSYEKGIDDLIDAAAIFHRTCPHVRFVVVGDGPDQVDLLRRIEARNVRGIVHLAGFMEDVWPALLAADIFCLPSKSEGMPNALLEAMSVSKPIVATAVGGVPEAIEHERNGLLTPPSQPRRLAEAIQRLVADPTSAQRLGASARETVEERFLACDVAARYAALYDQLVGIERGRCVAECC